MDQLEIYSSFLDLRMPLQVGHHTICQNYVDEYQQDTAWRPHLCHFQIERREQSQPRLFIPNWLQLFGPIIHLSIRALVTERFWEKNGAKDSIC